MFKCLLLAALIPVCASAQVKTIPATVDVIKLYKGQLEKSMDGCASIIRDIRAEAKRFQCRGPSSYKREVMSLAEEVEHRLVPECKEKLDVFSWSCPRPKKEAKEAKKTKKNRKEQEVLASAEEEGAHK